ncbi:MAG: TOMM precursor leader peptide-binding protein [Pyrinomonadaceae bacterium]
MKEEQVEPVHLLSVGTFGRVVADYLRMFREDISETAAEDYKLLLSETRKTWPIARITVIAAWRPVLELCELLDDFSHEWQRPFVPLVLDAKALRLGPVVIPGRGSCWHCWSRRLNQHSAWTNAEAALLQHYKSNPDSGPRGYLEPFAMMAATRIAHIIDALDSSQAMPGHIWQIDMMTREITTSTVVGIHDCPRCGLHRPAPTRSFAEMQSELAYLWTHATRER